MTLCIKSSRIRELEYLIKKGPPGEGEKKGERDSSGSIGWNLVDDDVVIVFLHHHG
jgi:hypothetical protein